MKKLNIFLLVFSIALCGLGFAACTPLYEKATCKIDGIGKAYYSLAAAIKNCPADHSIYVYNDVDEKSSTQEVLSLAHGQLEQKVYVQYIIDKPITIQGVRQNGKYPKIFGSFVTDLSDSEEIDKTISFYNVHIKNDYISTENNAQNLPFVNAVEVKNGSIEMENCTISKTFNMDNNIVKNNNLSLLSGVAINRKNIEEFKDKTYNYIFENCSINGYNNFNDENSSFGLSFQHNGSGYGTLNPFNLNYSEYRYDVLNAFNNSISGNSTNFQNIDLSSHVYYDLYTNNSALIKENYFVEGSNVVFFGDNFGFDEVTDFNVYGKMEFSKATNVHFIIKNSSARANVAKGVNVTVVPFE